MGTTTAISWTDKTWNPWRGCVKISPGCKNCYMFRDQARYGKDPTEVVRTKTWNDPPKWQRQAEQEGTRYRVFTCSWSDFFIEDADEWRADAWEVIRQTPNLTYQILTKRPWRITFPSDGRWRTRNYWIGVSVESRDQLDRVDTLRYKLAPVRFLSIEPLLEDLGTINLSGIDWVIVGGESGPNFRTMHHDWVRNVRDQCLSAGVPFFFKQSSGLRSETGVELDGVVHHAMPKVWQP